MHMFNQFEYCQDYFSEHGQFSVEGSTLSLSLSFRSYYVMKTSAGFCLTFLVGVWVQAQGGRAGQRAALSGREREKKSAEFQAKNIQAVISTDVHYRCCKIL